MGVVAIACWTVCITDWCSTLFIVASPVVRGWCDCAWPVDGVWARVLWREGGRWAAIGQRERPRLPEGAETPADGLGA